MTLEFEQELNIPKQENMQKTEHDLNKRKIKLQKGQIIKVTEEIETITGTLNDQL